MPTLIFDPYTDNNGNLPTDGDSHRLFAWGDAGPPKNWSVFLAQAVQAAAVAQLKMRIDEDKAGAWAWTLDYNEVERGRLHWNGHLAAVIHDGKISVMPMFALAVSAQQIVSNLHRCVQMGEVTLGLVVEEIFAYYQLQR